MIGAGKTTRAKLVEAERGAVRFSPDEWLLELMADIHDRQEMDRLRPIVEALQWRVARSLLENGADVVLENGFWHRDERLRLLEEAHALGARVVLHLLDAPPEELKRRVASRNRVTEARSLKISAEEIDRWLGYFEPPDADELSAYDEVETG